ncbi:hypothetical protein GALL_307140 [mine drainage metagenome]|uniref:Uncharacterized protein n=1 Tax=mine drainage metagenome TaxID=410659 RepID=A0A1J5RCN3_9ZZZZ
MATRFNKVSVLLAVIALFIGFAGNALAGDYEGKWILNDTNGAPFEATLSKDGTASGTHKDAMKHGTWKEEDGAAVIHWNTGWTTRIAKQGNKYVKSAFKPGASLQDTPTNTSEARKKK